LVGDEYPKLKVAAVHAASEFLDRDACVEKACALIAEAGAQGAKLIAFPETYLPGYPFWAWTHTPKTGAPLFDRLFRNSIDLPSDASRAIGDAARAAGAWVAMGINERDGGTLYNTIAYFDDHGRLVARHRKLVPTHVERTIWGRGDGSDVFVLDTPHGKLGGLICFEHTMDLNRYALTALGEQIHVGVWPGISALTADPNSSNFNKIVETAARHHALVSQSFVVNVSGRIDENALDMMGMTNSPELMVTGGGWSGIVAPNGQPIVENVDDEKIFYADIDLGDIILMGKYVCDSAGHYARPDVFRFSVNTQPQSVLTGHVPAILMADAEPVGPELVAPNGSDPA
jgi:nitrilase